jgi:hypothetical protein
VPFDTSHPPGLERRRYLRLAALALLAGGATAIPFWVGRIVPLLDLPQHLALVTVLTGHSQPGWALTSYFVPEWGEFTPYWFSYAAMRLLAVWLPTETAARVFLTLYALSFPWAAMALCRAFGRAPEIGLLAAPLALNSNLALGFLNYCAGVVLLLFALAACERHLSAPTPGRAALLALLSATIFFTHVQICATFLGLCFLLALLHDAPQGLRARLQRLAPATLPAALLMLSWLYGMLVDGPRHDFGRLGRMHAHFGPIVERLRSLPGSLAGFFQDGSDAALLAAWTVCILLLLLRPDARRPPEGSWRQRTRLPALVLAAGLGYFFAPLDILGQWNIAQRFSLPALLLALGQADARTAARRRFAAVAALTLSLAAGANAAWHFRLFDRELGPFDEALSRIPPGARILSLSYDPDGAVLQCWPYLNLGQYYTTRRGGLVAGSFANAGATPVRLRERPSRPPLNPFTPEAFDCRTDLEGIDFVLTHGGAPPQAAGCGLRLLYQGGAWRVYAAPATPSDAAGMR